MPRSDLLATVQLVFPLGVSQFWQIFRYSQPGGHISDLCALYLIAKQNVISSQIKCICDLETSSMQYTLLYFVKQCGIFETQFAMKPEMDLEKT